MEEIFDVLREPVIIFDAKGRPVRANTAVYRVFGLHGPPADAKGYLDLVRSLDIRTLDGCEVGLDALPSRRILRGEDRVQETYVLRHRAGHDLVMEVHATRLEQAGVSSVVTVWRDITEQHKAQQALREGEARFRPLFDNMLEGFALGEALLDEAGRPRDLRLLEVNAGFERQTGLDRQILGRPVREVLRHLEQQWVDVLGEVALTGVPQRVEGHNLDTGRYYEAFCYSPEKGRFGVLFRDTSHERAVAEAIRELSQRLTYHVDHSPLAVIEWGPDMRLTRWAGEAERLFGWKAEEVLGKRIEDLHWVYVEDRDRVRGVSADLETGQDTRRFSSNRNYRKDGSVVCCEWYNSSLVDEQGRLRSILSLVLDVTPRVRLEEELRQQAARLEEANRLKDEFLATLSHELRTPLNSILGWAHMMAGGQLSAPVVQKAVRAIYRNAQAQSRLVAEVLDVSRIVRGKLRLELGPVNLRGTLDRAVEAVQAAADAKRLRLELHDEEWTRPIVGDDDRLQQVFWNLLSNAVKFTPTGGQVDVLVAPCGENQVEVTVRDNGVGIPPAFLPHVFERFTQADSSTTRQHGGLGLGLSIVRYLVELHGGSVAAESQGEGHGAIFRVRLPLRAPQASRDSEAPARSVESGAQPMEGPDLGGIQVLLVEDDPDGRDVVEAILGSRGAQVIAARSAEEGLRLLQAAPPDLIVADIGMPGMDGYEFIHHVRERPAEAGGRTPAVAVTGYGRAEDRVRALRAGFQQHVSKPVAPEELLAVVSSLVGR